jgi:hypothetical protein
MCRAELSNDKCTIISVLVAMGWLSFIFLQNRIEPGGLAGGRVMKREEQSCSVTVMTKVLALPVVLELLE